MRRELLCMEINEVCNLKKKKISKQCLEKDCIDKGGKILPTCLYPFLAFVMYTCRI